MAYLKWVFGLVLVVILLPIAAIQVASERIEVVQLHTIDEYDPHSGSNARGPVFKNLWNAISFGCKVLTEHTNPFCPYSLF